MPYREIARRTGLSDAEASAACLSALRKIKAQRDIIQHIFGLSCLLRSEREARIVPEPESE